MNETIAAGNFARWNTALLTGNSANIVALYAQNLTLLPTLRTKTISGRAGAEKYFEFFASFHPTVEILEQYVISVSIDSYIHCGVYRFIVDTPKGRRAPLDARFTFVWKKHDETWEILHHHSSRVLVVTPDGGLLNGVFGSES